MSEVIVGAFERVVPWDTESELAKETGAGERELDGAACLLECEGGSFLFDFHATAVFEATS